MSAGTAAHFRFRNRRTFLRSQFHCIKVLNLNRFFLRSTPWLHLKAPVVALHVFKAHRLCVSLNCRLENNNEEEEKGRTPPPATSPQSGTKTPFSVPLVCTAARQNPAIFGTNLGARKRRLGPALRAVGVKQPTSPSLLLLLLLYSRYRS